MTERLERTMARFIQLGASPKTKIIF